MSKQTLSLIEAYQAANPDPFTTHDVARWAIDNGLWEGDPQTLVRSVAASLSRTTFVDPQGRRVRKFLCVRA